MGIDIGHDGRELSGFYDVFFQAIVMPMAILVMTTSLHISNRNVVKIVQSIAQRAHTH